GMKTGARENYSWLLHLRQTFLYSGSPSLSVYFSPALFIIKKLPDVIQFTLTDFFFSICSQNTVDIHFILSGHSFTGKKAVKH
ncbi:hypothetical protein AEW43_24235, partial [Salmonella enterica subsp. enterica serovar Kentucky]